MTVSSAVFETVQLTKIYPGTLALDAVSLSFPPGKVSVVIGRNGAGKSTLVKILSGVIQPTAGEILLDGATLTLRSPSQARARGIATVHQELSLLPGLSVGENVLFGRLPRRSGLPSGLIDWRRLYQEARSILEGLDVHLNVRAPVASLSLAERHMVEVARAVSSRPRVVLFDEPTAGLGLAETRTLLHLTRRLARGGVTVLYITHRLGEILEIADTVSVLRDGRLAATIPPSEATSRKLVELMYGEAPADDEVMPVEAKSLRESRAAPGSGGDSDTVLEVDGLAYRNVLRGVSFRLHAGEILGIAGMLGSGRTELLMGLFGGLRADSGRVTLPPRRSMSASACRPSLMASFGLALVPEDRAMLGLVSGLSTLDNVCLANLRRLGTAGFLSRTKQRRAVAPLLQDLGVVAADLDAPVTVLSGGNQQKIVLGKWLIGEPRILLCDEPTRGIDVRAKRQVFDILKSASRKGVASIVVSSELEELIELCDRILVLRGGTISAEVDGRGITLDRLFALCMEPSAQNASPAHP